MTNRLASKLLGASAALSLTAAAGGAVAQESAPDAAPAPPPPPSAAAAPSGPRAETADHARFRGGIRLEAGMLAAPGPGVTLGAIGAQGDIGAQINDLVGVYVAPSLDIIVGDLGGVNLGTAVVVDFTFDDQLQIGVGPDVGVFAALGSTASSASAAGGELYGGRVHFAYLPLVGDGADGVRRKGLALGLDVRMLVGTVGFATVSTSGGSASTTDFIISPMVSLGYQAF